MDFSNHHRFTLRCLDCGFILVSCKSKNPIRTPNNYKIIRRAETQLRHEIRCINNGLNMIKIKRDTCRDKLASVLGLDQDFFSKCLEFIEIN